MFIIIKYLSCDRHDVYNLYQKNLFLYEVRSA